MHSLPIKNRSGRLVGTHQKLDRIARKALNGLMEKNTFFPTAKEIVYFEGMRGPDGLKRKCPGIDEPTHFIIPENDDKKLLTQVLDCQANLKKALKEKNKERSAFEASWLAHYLTDALTPAHHFPLSEKKEELMSEKEYYEIFGHEFRQIMRGDSPIKTVKNNWSYYGKNGHMTKHFFFEYKIARIVSIAKTEKLLPKFKIEELQNINLEKEFYNSVNKIHALNLYNRYKELGWTGKINQEVKKILLPEIIKLITLAWYSCI